MKQFIFIVLNSLFITTVIIAQPITAYHPFTADGARFQNSSYVVLKWKNPFGTTSNEIYISYDSARVAQLDPTVKYSKTIPLVESIIFNPQGYFARYFWCVVETGTLGNIAGPIWWFSTKGTSHYLDVQIDDFEFGTGNWTITGNQFSRWSEDQKENYLLPVPAYNKVFSVKNTQQGIQNISTALLITNFTLSNSVNSLSLNFSSDLKLSSGSSVSIEFSTNNGSSWGTIYTANATERNTDKYVGFPTGLTSSSPVLLKLKADLRDTSNWWAIDKFTVLLFGGLLSPPTLFISNASKQGDNVVALTISNSLGMPSLSVYRKFGFPSSSGSYSFLANTYGWQGSQTFYDSSAINTVYTYYVGGSGIAPSNDATAYLIEYTPVELTSFTATQINNEVQLSWTTASETNNKGFHVERSIDRICWVEIAFINGAGTTVSSNNYSYLDNITNAETIYYRLKQEDFDGSIEYSDIAEVNFLKPVELTFESYPNPTNPFVTIMYSLPDAAHVSLKIFDITGREAGNLVNEFKEAGQYSSRLNTLNLASGMYIFYLQAGELSAVNKLVVVK